MTSIQNQRLELNCSLEVLVKCPYCNTIHKMFLPIAYHPKEYVPVGFRNRNVKTVVTCIKKDGGCGRDFVGYTEAFANTTSLTIEGVN